jgi:hypothetical protein
MTDRHDRGETGPSGNNRGAREIKRERDRAAMGHRHVGPGGTVSGDTVQIGIEPIQI